MSRIRSFMKVSASFAALSIACAAHAQSAPETPAPAATPVADQQDDDIVVSGQREQQERSIEFKREAVGVLDVAAADAMGRLPDRNVAEVVEHLPGVGVAYDQGEGRYVSIRGVPSNLNGYTLDGLELGSPDGQTRKLPLDIVSGQLLNRVEVAKVKTADMDGQGIGGTINLVTQTAFDFDKAFNFAGSFQAGYQTLNKKVPIQGDVSLAKRFGAGEQFGIMLGASYSDRNFASDGFYPDDWEKVNGAARGGMPTNIKYTEYQLDRRRLGATASFDWRPTDKQSFFVRSVYSKFIENEIRPRYRLDFATAALMGLDANGNITSPNFKLNPDGVTGTVTGKATSADGSTAGSGPERREDLRLDYKAKSVFTTMAGGSSEFDKLKLDYVGSYTRNEVLDQYPLWQFRCNPGNVNFDFTNNVYSASPQTECTPNQLQFRQYDYFHQKGIEDIWQGKLDAKYDLGKGSFLKVGAKYRSSDRGFDENDDTWARGGNAATRFTLGQFGLSGPDETVYPDPSNPNHGYVNSPVIDPNKIQDFTDKNLNGPLFVKDVAGSLENAVLDDFTVTERVYAGYAMANLKLGPVTITPGVRYEHTTLDIVGYQLEDDATVSPAQRHSQYDDWLPTLIVRIEPSNNTVFRFAYSRSIGRPEFNLLSPGGTISTDVSDEGIRSAGVSFGNPDLKPYRADNLDATAEWYFAKGGLFSVGVFAKFIKDPIFTKSILLNNADFNGQHYDFLSISQPLNADKGDIIGIEAQYQQQFTFLPGVLSGLGIQLTGTLTDSNLRLPDGRSSVFPEQSNYLYGASLFYQRGPVEASVSYHNTGKALISAGDTLIDDQWNNDLRRLDFKASFTIMKSFKIFFEGQNLTDEPTRQYQAGNPNWLIQSERYGRTFYSGISFRF
jgi:TonB-dependent receptor